MKKVKMFVLFFCLILMTGCGYDDVYKEYKDVLDSLDCTYVSTQYGESDPYPEDNYKINFSANSTGVYINLNGSKYPFYDKDGKHTVKLGDYDLTASDNTLKDFLEKYENNGNTCPSQFFAKVSVQNPSAAELATSCSAGDGVTGMCFLYTLQDNSSTKNNLVKSNKYKRYSDVLNKELEIQFGYDVSTKKSYLYMDNVEYEFEDDFLFTSIQNYDVYLKVDSSDYDDIFKINGDNVTFPKTIYLGREGATSNVHGSDVLAITTDPNKYDYYDEGENPNPQGELNDDNDDDNKNHGFTPNALCEDGKCDISLKTYCETDTVARTLKFLGLLFYIAKILVPAIIVIMGLVNLFKIITSSKMEDAPKYAKSVVIRIAIGILIFLLPNIIFTIYEAADYVISPNKTSDFDNCINCVLKPNSTDCKIKKNN